MCWLLFTVPLSLYGIYWALPSCAMGIANWYHWGALLAGLYFLKSGRLPVFYWVYLRLPTEEACLLITGASAFGVYWTLPMTTASPEWYWWVALLASLWCLMPGPLPWMYDVQGKKFPTTANPNGPALDGHLLTLAASGFGIYWALQACASGNTEWYNWLILLVSLRYFASQRTQRIYHVPVEPPEPPEETAGSLAVLR